MKRREAIKNLAIFTGGAIMFSSGLLVGCNSSEVRIWLSDDDVLLLDEIGETIIPKTKECEGAKAAKIGTYMKLMADECLTKKERQIFLVGLTTIEDAAREKFSTDFMDLKPIQKKELFMEMQSQAEKEKKDSIEKSIAIIPIHYFQLFKDLTIHGYFTSEIGITEARRYEAVPGRYNGCIDYKKGDKAWATS
ncbi:hypothetical protein A5893_02495 [Pedobacter psychrophilus]|uniref:Twin-arginine translocation pathway signal protein n=1 Tax=Pedobacter psychrophilus TaxID=1826909 RepID=A0A179DLQ9_9SPHI|nr:gluconate 2-dehydrogenase subunit 3 family protein [Pedobacter psychrophilus]OAQ42007.1 hypothetical protein A5893_02495 [Pedobacter psychrophilus]